VLTLLSENGKKKGKNGILRIRKIWFFSRGEELKVVGGAMRLQTEEGDAQVEKNDGKLKEKGKIKRRVFQKRAAETKKKKK